MGRKVRRWQRLQTPGSASRSLSVMEPERFTGKSPAAPSVDPFIVSTTLVALQSSVSPRSFCLRVCWEHDTPSAPGKQVSPADVCRDAKRATARPRRVEPEVQPAHPSPLARARPQPHWPSSHAPSKLIQSLMLTARGTVATVWTAPKNRPAACRVEDHSLA